MKRVEVGCGCLWRQDLQGWKAGVSVLPYREREALKLGPQGVVGRAETWTGDKEGVWRLELEL